MDKAFWQAILDADGAVPEGYAVAELTPELLALLGSTDPFLRDEVAMEVLAAWIVRDNLYTPDELRSIGDTLAHNLTVGLGEQGSDSVFLRAFSALVLDKVIEADNWWTLLSPEDIRRWMEQALAYVAVERDLRGYVPGKGWAHALAHTADVLWVLAQSRHMGAADLERILVAIADKVNAPTEYPYLAMEDERLANAVWAGLRRDLLGLPFLSTWLSRLARPFQETPRSEVVIDAHKTNAFHNTRLLLHSLYFQLVLGVRPPPWYTDMSFFMGAPALRDDLLPLVVGTLRAIDPGFYAKG
ncbi:MAG: DUF2785 domain-containing protein [Roseiflexaceae bacterium]